MSEEVFEEIGAEDVEVINETVEEEAERTCLWNG